MHIFKPQLILYSAKIIKDLKARKQREFTSTSNSDDGQCYFECYFEDSEACSDLNKEAQYDSFAMLAMGEGKTQETFLTILV